jgi:regulator of replication initiation timing
MDFDPQWRAPAGCSTTESTFRLFLSMFRVLGNLPALIIALRENTAVRLRELDAARPAPVPLTESDRVLINKLIMKLQELMPELGSLEAQLRKVFGEQQKSIDELKLKVEDLTARLGNTEIPEDAKGVLGEMKALVQRVDDLIPDISNPGTGIELGTPPVAPKPAAQPKEQTQKAETSAELQEAHTIAELQKIASDEDIDIGGVTLKSDIADTIVAARKEGKE